jgi:hypothetical protein
MAAAIAKTYPSLIAGGALAGRDSMLVGSSTFVISVERSSVAFIGAQPSRTSTFNLRCSPGGWLVTGG